MCEPWKPRNGSPARNGLRGNWECRAAHMSAKAYIDIPALELMDVELPGVVGGGMSGRNGQRKPGTTRGSPRRSRTAKAPHISRWAVKLRCACEWDGWGRLSDDGPGQHNLDRSEGPWGRWGNPPNGGALSSPWPGSVRDNQCRPRDARRVKTNQAYDSGCREQA